MKKVLFFSIVSIALIVFDSCKKEKEEKEATENATTSLFAESTISGYNYYNNGALLNSAGNGPHGSFKLRYNSVALSALDSTGKLPVNGIFPSGSILVKDVYTNGNISLYAVMKKDPTNVNAGSGWVWAEFNTDGSSVFALDYKGDGCINCHSNSPNRDLVRTFDLY